MNRIALRTQLRTFACALMFAVAASGRASAATPAVAVGPQYDTTHVYIAAADFDRFIASFAATFDGTVSKQAVVTVTPTPSTTKSQVVFTPSGTISVFGFETPIPYPFGAERTGYLVSDMAAGVQAAAADGADVLVAPFNDPIGKDAIVQWPGGVNMQLYWHTVTPSYAPLAMVPENRVYVSPNRADDFVRDFIAFSHGTVVSDDAHAPAIDIGRPGETFRRVRITSNFGKLTVLVTNGFVPYPYGRELSGYEVSDLAATLTKAKAAGATILAGPYDAGDRHAAIVQFPGGYIAEVHAK